MEAGQDRRIVHERVEHWKAKSFVERRIYRGCRLAIKHTEPLLRHDAEELDRPPGSCAPPRSQLTYECFWRPPSLGTHPPQFSSGVECIRSLKPIQEKRAILPRLESRDD